jgi:predicted SAM-dependent methyltransferase
MRERLWDRLLYGIAGRLASLCAGRTSTGVTAQLHELRWECDMVRRHRRGVRAAAQYARKPEMPSLHLGCGERRKAGWVNIDAASGDLTLDLREPLPFPDGSIHSVYSEHFLEHVDYPEATLRLLRECWRVLGAGGVIDIGVPDTEWPLMEYAGLSTDGYFTMAKTMWHPAWCQTRLEHLNYHFRQGTQHRFAYDYETLERVLLEAGFVKVRRRKFSEDHDSAHREIGTLYVVGQKP